MSDPGWTIRKALAAEIPAVAALYHRVWHEIHAEHMPVSEQQLRDEADYLRRATALMPNVIVGKVDETLGGFAAWTSHVLGQLYVEAAYRGTGLARNLMIVAECALRAQEIEKAELHCLVGNDRGRRFYERLGWSVGAVVEEPVGRDDQIETRSFWVMTKTLS